MWNDLVSLLGEDGGSDGCWCMSWRSTKELTGAEAKRALNALVSENKVNGIIIYSGDKPVGWTTYGPRVRFPNANKHPDFKSLDSSAFSIPCFFINEEYRGKGLSKALLDSAIIAAKEDGAEVLEAYPVKNNEPDDVKKDWAFTGSEKMFSSTGFKSCTECKYELGCFRKKL